MFFLTLRVKMVPSRVDLIKILASEYMHNIASYEFFMHCKITIFPADFRLTSVTTVHIF